jgi:methylmalonyl-CoA mutase C-terminal domain/subunit
MTKTTDDKRRPLRVLLAKTSLDGHWRGVAAVGGALRKAGLEVVMIGMARPEEIVTAAVEEDVDLIGLNVGGRVEIVIRIVETLRSAGVHVPLIAGGTISPHACRSLEARGIPVFPPGSMLSDIVETASNLATEKREGDGA